MRHLQIVTEGPPKLPKQSVWAAYQRGKSDAQLKALTQLVLDQDRRLEELEAAHGR